MIHCIYYINSNWQDWRRSLDFTLNEIDLSKLQHQLVVGQANNIGWKQVVSYQIKVTWQMVGYPCQYHYALIGKNDGNVIYCLFHFCYSSMRWFSSTCNILRVTYQKVWKKILPLISVHGISSCPELQENPQDVNQLATLCPLAER